MRRIVKKMKTTMMAFTVCMVMVLGLLSPASSATYTVTQATSNDYGDFSPKICNNGDMVWSYNDEIFIKDGTTGLTRQLTNNGVSDNMIEVNDNGDIVWLQVNIAELDYNVMLYTKATNTIIRISLPANPLFQHSDSNPQLNNLGQVVYESYDNNDQEIMLYDGATVTQVTNNVLNDTNPRINNNGDIVWRAYVKGTSNGDIWLRTAGTNTPITATPNDDAGPRINNAGDIVWSGMVGTVYQVWYYQKSNGQKTQWTSTAVDNIGARINANGAVTWTAGIDTSDYDIWHRSGPAGTNQNISLQPSHDDINPQINANGWVTWQEDQGTAATNDQIFVWDGTTVTRLQTDAYDHINPRINNYNTVVWEGTGGTGATLTDYEIWVGLTGLCADAATRCNDNNVCTNDTCNMDTGACVNTTVICNDNSLCTTDTCVLATGCVYTPVVCNDNSLCTTDTCVPATGCVYTPIVCNDTNLCTTDTCNPATQCVFTPKCNDNELCTTDSCNGTTGACTNTPVVCNDSNVCTADTCNPTTGTCVYTPNGVCAATINNNFTMFDTNNNVAGGTNDIYFAWDGNTRTSVVPSGQISNALLTSTCIYSSSFWKAHDLAVYSTGTYTVYTACPAGSPGCGLTSDPTGINCPVGKTCPPITFTVKTGELGIHMLFDWGGNTNIDVVNVLKPNAKFAPSPMAAEGPYFCGSNSSCTVWGWMSYDPDTDNDSFNGIPMVDGPFPGFSPNFSYNKVTPVDLCCNAATRCNDNNACTTDTCNTATGACVNTTIVCNDNNLCTVDTCNTATGCVFTPKNCSDNNACTTDTCDPATGICTSTVKNCNDNNACTIDSCNPLFGCINIPDTCDDNNVCTADTCNTATGCVRTATNNGSACNDNNICTTGEVCSNGVCAGTETVPVSCNDNNICTTDGCTANACTSTATVPASCNDNNICTTDGCSANACTTTAIVPASCDDNNICTTATCANNTCGQANNTLTCNDNSSCTTGDVCSNGVCAGAQKNCSDNNACTTDTCDPATGICTSTVKNCNDNNACTTDYCATLFGCYSIQKTCNDNNVCTTDSCNTTTGDCVFNNNTSSCNDNNICTTGDVCSNGVCTEGTATVPASCNDNNPCTTDTCANNTCGNTNNTALCSDNNPCTTSDTCSGGVCVGGAATVCLNTGVCDPATGCPSVSTHGGNLTVLTSLGLTLGGTNDVKLTMDGSIQSAATFSNGTGPSNATLTTDQPFATIPWTARQVQVVGPGTYWVDLYGSGTGTTRFEVTIPAGRIGAHMLFDWGQTKDVDVWLSWDFNKAFAAGKLWTGADNGSTGTGVIDGSPNVSTAVWQLVSVDLAGRITDSAGTTITNLPLDNVPGIRVQDPGGLNGYNVNFNVMSQALCADAATRCNDNNPCTTDLCAVTTGVCSHPAKNCSDNNKCTTDTCTPATGACVNTPVVIDDNNACTTDSCNTSSGVITHTPKVCNDNNLCTTDTCNTATGACVFTNNTVACNDNNICTENDACSNGACTGSAKACYSGGVCDTVTGCPPVNTHGGNFSLMFMFGSYSFPIGGTNDVTFWWDGTLQDAATFDNGNGPINASIISDEPFGRWLWNTKQVQVVGPGTYWVYLDGGAGDPTRFEVTIPAGKIGAHMLFDWGSTDPALAGYCGKMSCDADVWLAWDFSKAYAAGKLYTGADNGTASTANLNGLPYVTDGSPNASTSIWGLASVDLAGRITDSAGNTIKNLPLDGVPGIIMNDGSLLNYSVDFSVMLKDLCADAATRCNDNSACTIDSCNVTTGACVNASKNCSDNNKCTTDTCTPATGACINTPVVINDNNACTTDSCNTKTGAITHTVNVICNDNNTCTTDTCNPANGACVFTNNTLACNDNNICTENDVCSGGVCAGTTKVCYSGGVCNTTTGCPPVSTSGNNLTLMSYGSTMGGTNDVKFWWDGTLQDAATFDNGNGLSNATISSDEPFGGWLWYAKQVQVVGPGTYWVYLDGGAGDPTRFEVTIPVGKIGAHMFFDWGSTDPALAGYCGKITCDADVWIAWDFNQAFAAGQLWTGADNGITANANLDGLPYVKDGNVNATTKVWGLASVDLAGRLTDSDGNTLLDLPMDGIPGIGMNDGTLAGFNANFNVRLQ